MSTITISDKATTITEVIKELRDTAGFFEALADVKGARVVVTGELNFEVRFDRVAQAEPVPEPE